MNKERLYSVTMTEEELKLFSEFVGEQREFNSDRFNEWEDSIRKAARGELSEDEARIAAINGWYVDSELKRDTARKSVGHLEKDFTPENHKMADHNIIRFDDSVANHKEIINKKYNDLMDLNHISKELNEKQKRDLFRPVNPSAITVDEEDVPIISEAIPAEKGDKLLRRFKFDRKVDVAKDRVDSMYNNAKDSVKHVVDTTKEKAREASLVAQDRWDVLGEKYGDMTGRKSLNKDAAIAAGVLGGATAVGLGVHAFRKHKKKKKAEKEKATSKYKTKK